MRRPTSPIKQNDPKVKDGVFNRSGCTVRTLMNIGEDIAGKFLTSSEIVDIWERAKKEKWIVKDGNEFRAVKNQNIINKTVSVLGGHGKVFEIGVFSCGKTTRYAWAKNGKYPITHLMQKIEQPGKHPYHFRRVSHCGMVLFDPYFPDVQCLKPVYSVLFSWRK